MEGEDAGVAPAPAARPRSARKRKQAKGATMEAAGAAQEAETAASVEAATPAPRGSDEAAEGGAADVQPDEPMTEQAPATKRARRGSRASTAAAEPPASVDTTARARSTRKRGRASASAATVATPAPTMAGAGAGPASVAAATASTPFPSETEMSGMKVAQLREALSTHGLSTGGRKADLLRRLSEAAVVHGGEHTADEGAAAAGAAGAAGRGGSRLRRPTARGGAVIAIKSKGKEKALEKASMPAADTQDGDEVPLAIRRLHDSPGFHVADVDGGDGSEHHSTRSRRTAARTAAGESSPSVGGGARSSGRARR